MYSDIIKKIDYINFLAYFNQAHTEIPTEAGFYQQLSNWYCRYGNAVNKLYSILKKEA